MKASNEETKSVLRSNLQIIKDQQPSIKNALRLNILTGAVLGGLIMLFLVFLGINVWLGYQIKDKKQELAEINLELDQSPLEKRILRSVEFHEQGQEDLFHRSQEQQKSGSIREHQRPKSNENREIGNQYDQRLYESLQRHLELVRDAIERAKRNKSKTDRADRSLERSESSIESAERGIEQSKSTTKQSEQQITRAEQRINEKMKEKQAEIKADRGFYR